MSFLRKIFGKKPVVSVEAVNSTVGSAPAIAITPPPIEPAKVPKMIRVHDAYGRELFIPREQWRENVLLGHLTKVRDEPDALAQAILHALQDGFLDDLIEPSEHLSATDPIPERGAVILAGIYREKKRLEDSECVLRAFIAQYGETGTVLTNLAKIHADRAEPEQVLTLLWRGIELEPNQDNAVGWYAALQREKGGDSAVIEAMRRIAALPGSWRARLWLARDSLQRRQLDEAIVLYREALGLAGSPVPADLLMQMSGDLGNAAHLPELLTLTVPHFDLAVHGLQVGNNLLKAHLDLGRLDDVRALLDRLYACQRPDWKTHLEFWDGELAKARLATTAVPPEAKVEFALLHGDGPIWLPPDSPAAELFPAGTGERLQIAFLGSSGETPANSGKVVAQLSDGAGRLSRALPLFLAEQVFFQGRARVRPLVPWVRGDTTAFAFCGAPWEADTAAHQARLLEPAADYVVVTHLKTATDPWHVELRLIRTIDAKALGSLEAVFPMEQPEASLCRLAADLVGLLHAQTGLEAVPRPAEYRVPDGVCFADYLLRLEQLLAIRCYAIDEASARELHGEREIFDGTIHLCLAQPGNVVPRLLLAQAARRLRKPAPHIVAEYRGKIELLQNEQPLPAPARAIVARLFAEVYPPWGGQ